MTSRIGVTGHRNLPADAVPEISSRFRSVLDIAGSGTVISSLAAGADQALSTLAIARGFDIEVVVPCAGYDETFSPDEIEEYRSLFAAAIAVTTLDFAEPSEHAYMAAGKAIVDSCDLLVAVWDGLPARGYGGTGDVTDYAHACGRPVRVIWPEGTTRE
jgi:hypothetical protein